MSKLNKEELLRETREVFDHYLKDLRDYPSEVTVKQACQQIKELIRIEFLPNTSWEKSQITMEEAKTMIASLSNEIAKLEKKKPEVTEEFIDVHTNTIAHGCDKFKNWTALKKGIKNRITTMLKEAGVRVV